MKGDPAVGVLNSMAMAGGSSAARFANSQIGAGAPIVKPLGSEELDYEGELAVIIGRAKAAAISSTARCRL